MLWKRHSLHHLTSLVHTIYMTTLDSQPSQSLSARSHWSFIDCLNNKTLCTLHGASSRECTSTRASALASNITHYDSVFPQSRHLSLCVTERCSWERACMRGSASAGTGGSARVGQPDVMRTRTRLSGAGAGWLASGRGAFSSGAGCSAAGMCMWAVVVPGSAGDGARWL